MKKICSMTSAVIFASSLLAACGGGGGESSTTELQGKWIASTDGNPAGDACGLTSSGKPGERYTITFNVASYAHKSEYCTIISGNKGTYTATHTASGTFHIGEVTVQSEHPAGRLRALDLMSSRTAFTSYNLVGNTLHIALPSASFDGSARDKRAFHISSFYDPVSKSMVDNPAYLKQ